MLNSLKVALKNEPTVIYGRVKESENDQITQAETHRKEASRIPSNLKMLFKESNLNVSEGVVKDHLESSQIEETRQET